MNLAFHLLCKLVSLGLLVTLPRFLKTNPKKMLMKKLLRPLPIITLLRRSGTKVQLVSSSISGQIEQFPRVLKPYNFLGNNNLRTTLFCSKAAAPQKVSCWNCNSAKTPFLVCTSCGSVQPVDHSLDYFQIFGLEKKYEIEGENLLERKYKDWQRKLHPDLVHTKSQKEREYAAEQSARVIDAYRTLTDPLSRAKYVLKLEGVHVDEEGRIDDLELLAEMLEIRESVEEAANSQALKQIQGQIQGKFEQSSSSFADALQGRKFEEAVAAMQRMTYYKRANEEIVKKL